MEVTEREALFLNSILTDQTRFYIANSLVEPENLSVSAALVYTSARRIAEAGDQVSFESVGYHLSEHGLLDQLGGIAYVDAIKRIGFQIDDVTFKKLCDDIQRIGRTTELQNALRAIADDPELQSLESVIARTVAEIYRHKEEQAGIFQTIGEMIDAGEPDRETLATTSIASWDKIIDGVVSGEFHIIAARPSIGKTALMVQMAIVMSSMGIPVAFFSLEQKQNSLVRRAKRIAEAEILRRIPLYINTESGISVEKMLYRTQLAKILYGVQVVFLDYIGLLGGERRFKDRTDFVSHVSRMLQAISRNLNVALIAGSQLNRDVDRESREPELRDLRDSGTLEQDADIVTFIHRPGKGESAKLIVAKHREGEIGVTNVRFDKQTVTFRDS